MDKIRVLLADSAIETREALAKRLRETQSTSMELSASVSNGLEALRVLGDHPIDLLVMDLVLPGLDGFSLLEKLHAQRLLPKLKVLILTAMNRTDFIQRAVDLGADYYMLKPCEPDIVLERMRSLLEGGPKSPLSSSSAETGRGVPSLDVRISDIFFSIGLPAHIKGYSYLREAIKMAVDRPQILDSITGELYPSVARHFGTEPTKVERAIRHALDVTWARGQITNIGRFFDGLHYMFSEKPSNGEFIALLAERFRVERAASEKRSP
ncbi:MAG: sporulation transcription factor Spo0A [Christensenellaceae bacterium]|jgi:two-component system response regulator (stage 0 sporulation protein A)|nr:sporulation transcription factor Spo0A [Christensenellaceae bacterium]